MDIFEVNKKRHEDFKRGKKVVPSYLLDQRIDKEDFLRCSNCYVWNSEMMICPITGECDSKKELGYRTKGCPVEDTMGIWVKLVYKGHAQPKLYDEDIER